MTIRLRRILLLALFAARLAGCGSSPSGPTPTSPTSPPAAGATIFLSGIVFAFDATGRRPLAGATVEITESTWGDFSNPPITNASGRYILGPVPARHYRARATKAGFEAAEAVDLGFVDRSRNLDFELTDMASLGPVAVTAVEPHTGSTGGGATVKISGSGFRPGTIVTIGGERQDAYVGTSTVIWATTAAHATGAVDVVVTRADGDTATLARGFTYVTPQSFDFNGNWEGSALAHPESAARFTAQHSDMELGFTISGNALTGFTCGGSAIAMPSPLPSITNGEFFHVADRVEISGRIVSTDIAIGTINTPLCPGTRWSAGRRR